MPVLKTHEVSGATNTDIVSLRNKLKKLGVWDWYVAAKSAYTFTRRGPIDRNIQAALLFIPRDDDYWLGRSVDLSQVPDPDTRMMTLARQAGWTPVDLPQDSLDTISVMQWVIQTDPSIPPPTQEHATYREWRDTDFKSFIEFYSKEKLKLTEAQVSRESIDKDAKTRASEIDRIMEQLQNAPEKTYEPIVDRPVQQTRSPRAIGKPAVAERSDAPERI
jgi:hypothetical protein